MRFSVSPFSLPAAPRQAVAVSVSGKRGPQGSHCQGFGQASFASSAPAQCFFFTAFRFGRLFSFQKYPDMVPACFGGRLADSFLLVVFSSKIPAFSLESEAECVISYTNLLILSLKHYHPILWTRILLLPGDAFRFSFKWCCKSKSCTHITEKSGLGPILHPEKNVCEMLSGVFEESLSFPSTTLFPSTELPAVCGLLDVLCTFQGLQSVWWWWLIKQSAPEVRKSCYKFLITENHYLCLCSNSWSLHGTCQLSCSSPTSVTQSDISGKLRISLQNNFISLNIFK